MIAAAWLQMARRLCVPVLVAILCGNASSQGVEGQSPIGPGRRFALVIANGALRVLDPALAPAFGESVEAGRYVGSGPSARWLFDQDFGISVTPPSRVAGGAYQRTAPVINRRTRL